MWVEGRKSVAGVLWQTGMRLAYMVWGRGGSDEDLQLVYRFLWTAHLVCSQGLFAGLCVRGWVNGMSRGTEFGGEDLCDSLGKGLKRKGDSSGLSAAELELRLGA